MKHRTILEHADHIIAELWNEKWHDWTQDQADTAAEVLESLRSHADQIQQIVQTLTLQKISEDYSNEALTPLSPEAWAAHQPPPPDELVGALQDRVHVEKGKLISSTPIRRKRD